MRTVVLQHNNASQILDEVSADGRYFTSVDDSGGGPGRIYLTDSQTGATQTVATSSPSTGGTTNISETNLAEPILSQDAQFVVYLADDEHQATILDPTTNNWSINIFDRTTGLSHVVYSESDGGNTGADFTALVIDEALLSPDDQSVFFTSDFPDLTGDSTGEVEDLFKLNLQTHAIQTVLVGDATSELPTISLAPGGKYLVDAQANTKLINIATGNVDFVLPGQAALPHSVSADGRFVVFYTQEALIPEDTNGVNDVYLVDLTTADVELVSKSATTGAIGADNSFTPQISADGSEVLFETTSSTVSPGATDQDPHVVLWERETGYLNFEFDDSGGRDSYSLSADGHTIAVSTFENLVTGGNQPENIYLVHVSRPVLTINLVDANGYFNAADGTSVTISGTSDAIGQTISLTVAGQKLFASVQSNGNWSTSIDARTLADGVYSVHALVSDGLTATADSSFTIDRSPPQLNVTSVAGDNYINAAELTHAIVTGTVAIGDPAGTDSLAGNLQIKIDNGPSTDFPTPSSPTTSPQSFSDAINATGVADGAHTITVTAIDEAGNTTVKTINVIVDTTPPKVRVTSVSGDDVVSSSEIKTAQVVRGTSDAIGQTVNVLIDGAQAGQAMVQADGTWLTTISFAGTSTGDHDITAQVPDQAGNIGRGDAEVYVDAGFAVPQLSDGPNGQQGTGQGLMFPGLSADGTKLIFTGLNFDLMSVANGSSGAQVYIKDLTTGAITFATPDPSDNAEFGAISQDGTKIVFVSNASLDPTNQALNGDGPGYYTYEESLADGIPHIRVFDSQTPDTFNISVPAGDHLAQPVPVFPLAIANNGYDSEFVETTNISAGTVNLFENFVLDGSVDASGHPTIPYNQLRTFDPPFPASVGTYQAYAPQFSADGSVVAFEARFHAEQATGTQPGPNTQIYAGSSAQNQIPLASSFADGTAMPFGAVDPALSANGQFVAFWSWGNDGALEVFVKNLTTGELKVASSDALGNAGVSNASGTFTGGFNTIAISADGRYVAFTSDANLTPDDSGTGADLFVKDMQTGAIQRVPLPAGTFTNDLSTQLTLRADGQYVAFVTSASLSAFDANHGADIYGLSLASLGPPPAISIDPVTGDDKINGSEISTHLAVSGTSDDVGGTVTLVIDGNTFASNVIVGAGGTWSTTIDGTLLIDGVHHFRATVTNAGGATGSAGDLVTVDRTASINAVTAAGIDLRWGTLYDELANSPIATGGTATQYTAVDSGAFNGHTAAIKFVMTGTGLTYSGSAPNIQLTGGTITGIEEDDSSGAELAAFTGLSISAMSLQAALNAYPVSTPLNAIFLAPADHITGGAGADRLQGGNLDDTFNASTGNDTINGGTGSNTADYSGLITPGLFAIVQGGIGTVNKGGANGTDTLTTGIQNIVDNAAGRSNGDVFEVDAAENVSGNNANFNYLIELSTGVNLTYGTQFTGITEFVSNTGNNTVNFAADTGFAYLYGSTGNDTLTLGSGGGYALGEGGSNILNGGANATNLFIGGQGGTDTMNGGGGSASNYYFVDGNDQVNGAGAFNVVVELVAGITVQLGSAQYQDVQEIVSNGGANAVSVAAGNSNFNYLYGGTGDDTLTTGSGGGYLIGEGGTNVLTGGGGTNVFVADGGTGVDTMNGGSGSNIYFIDANSVVHGAGTFNTVIELQQNVSLSLGSSQLGSDIQEVVLSGGTNTVDFHTATSQVFLYGSAGNDSLFGGTGSDFLYGGAGTNTFQFAAGWGKDTIEDWTSGTNDIIDLTGLSSLGVHAITDLTQTISGGKDVITSSHTGTNSITLVGVGSALVASSFHFM